MNEMDFMLDGFYRKISTNYTGEMRNGKSDGKGRYIFPNGAIYEGDFQQGEFHGQGKLSFPGKGSYIARWEKGRAIEGSYYFQDELEYDIESIEQDGPDSWPYCTPDDRRFWSEIQNGIVGGAGVQLSNQVPPPTLPASCYDTGDGYYDPLEKHIFTYSGEYLRTPGPEEVQWIVDKCRISEDDHIMMQSISRPTSSMH
eukprot:TRINITY_DN6879_c0_g1_i5.p1 TRINITY_DN6879_c0_g1~~TRINITY_DN6879_c0_g1_i5.p1  ORF type:complete len:224 (+),score=23.40 TRINITY_DN6879_c0_g1_i5:78-674(+)